MSDIIVEVLPSEKIGVEVRGTLPVGVPGANGVSVTVAGGPPGPGVPGAGAAGQVLVKKTGASFDTEWRSMVLYGTSDPPDPSGLPDGVIYMKYS